VTRESSVPNLYDTLFITSLNQERFLMEEPPKDPVRNVIVPSCLSNLLCVPLKPSSYLHIFFMLHCLLHSFRFLLLRCCCLPLRLDLCLARYLFIICSRVHLPSVTFLIFDLWTPCYYKRNVIAPICIFCYCFFWNSWFHRSDTYTHTYIQVVTFVMIG